MTPSRFSTLILLAAAVATAQPAQQQDPEFARLVKEWTTRPEFMSPLVDHLPKVNGVPSPKDVLGYYVGAPKSSPTPPTWDAITAPSPPRRRG